MHKKEERLFFKGLVKFIGLVIISISIIFVINQNKDLVSEDDENPNEIVADKNNTKKDKICRCEKCVAKKPHQTHHTKNNDVVSKFNLKNFLYHLFYLILVVNYLNLIIYILVKIQSPLPFQLSYLIFVQILLIRVNYIIIR